MQTLYPEHYSIQLACRQDYPAFFEKELAYRRGMRYPPVVALVNVVVRGRSFDEAMQTATDIVRRLEPLAAARELQHPRTGAGAARAAARRAPRPVLPERHPPRRHAQRAEGGAGRDAGGEAAR